MPEQVILCGPAGSGKTERILSEYLEQVRAEGEDSALLLLPTRLARDRLQQRLISEGRLAGLFDPRILTFPDLADRILHANHEAVAQISDWQRELLMRSVVMELREAGELQALAPMCRYPGFTQSLCGLVEEIKRVAVDPAQFAERIEASGLNDPRSRELALVYARYQAALQERAVFDEAGRFWWARDVLSENRRRPFERLRSILLDGFEDFTTTQLQVLRLLAQGAERLVVTLCLEVGERRSELFRSPSRTLSRLREVFPDAIVEQMAAPEREGPLASLRENLFADSDPDAEAKPAEAIEILETSGRRAEVQQIAHRVKKLLVEGTAQPDRVGIVARDMTGYSRTLLEVFEEAGIPLYVAAPEPVGARPPVQAALDVLRVPAQGYKRSDVLRLLKSSYVDLASICPETEIDPDDVERLACAANILGGRDQWRERLQVYASRIEHELEVRRQGERNEDDQWFSMSEDELAAELRAVEGAQELVRGVFARLDELPAAAPRAEFVEKLNALLDDFGILARIGKVDSARIASSNVRAFSAFLKGLREMWGAQKQLGLSAPVRLDEFSADVLRMSQQVSYQRHGQSEGRVLAVSAADARQLDFDYVFLVGLCEGEFPRTPREDPIYSDQERRQLTRAGIPIEPKIEGQYRDAFAFYSVATAARKHLCLSYPTVDVEGREVIRSYYVDEVQRCFAQELEPKRYDLAHLVAEFEEITNTRELLERSLFELYGRDVLLQGRRLELSRSGINVLVAGDEELLASLRRAIEVEDRRDSRDPPDEYDGMLSAPATLAALGEQFGPEHRFSAHELAEYGGCPFAFLCERVLNLKEMEEPTEEVDAMLLGSLVHRCLRNFFVRWRGRKEDGQLKEGDLPAARELMDEIIGEIFGEAERLKLVADEVMFGLAREETRRDLHLLLEYEVEKMQAEGAVPTYFEQSFGMADRPSVLHIGEGEDLILLRGRIDRVDLLPSEDGVPHFAVYDYKLSGGPSSTAIERGEEFQLPVYALAAREAILQDPRAVCENWAYYRTRRGKKQRLDCQPGNKAVDELIAVATANALHHAAAMRSGRFYPAPADCRNCDFKHACRYQERRLAKKLPEAGDGDGGLEAGGEMREAGNGAPRTGTTRPFPPASADRRSTAWEQEGLGR